MSYFKKGLFKKFCHPTGYEWADYLARWGGIHSVGKGVWINPGANIPDPSLLRIGNNVGLSDCTIFGHDGLIGVFEISAGKQLDSVGAVDIFDNCFIGYQAIVMPGRMFRLGFEEKGLTDEKVDGHLFTRVDFLVQIMAPGMERGDIPAHRIVVIGLFLDREGA